MALNTSPRKVPLARGDESFPTKIDTSAPNVTRRVFFCGVVVESAEHGKTLPADVRNLVSSLGDPIDAREDNSVNDQPDDPHQRQRTTTDTSALQDVINELVTTERSYVRRLQILKYDYADPLRKFSRSRDTSILPTYEAKTLFGNIDMLLPVNEALSADLEAMQGPTGPQTVGGVGDVMLKHFKDVKGFEHYKQYYAKREEAQDIFEREINKKSSPFVAYIDRIKYSSADSRNRVGLRELLMDPVQRIPRYTLLIRTMMKFMAPDDPQRAKLLEAHNLASEIAKAETDDYTKRATVMYCLVTTIDGFPAHLFSHTRMLVDWIDVEDHVLDNGSISSLYCTLFLFDDKLILVKRPGNGERSAGSLTGIDDLEKARKIGPLPIGLKRSGLVCKGVVEITDVVATDVGGADIQFYLENLPPGDPDVWLGRALHSMSVVHPPVPTYLDPSRAEAEKRRFLNNLWLMQAKYRTRDGQSVAVHAQEREVESRAGRVTLAQAYFNVYQRKHFLREPKKTKIVVHIDERGTADPIPFGVSGPPFVVVRIQPMEGDLSRYSVTSSDPHDEGEQDIVQTSRVPAKIVQTIQQFGLFTFRSGRASLPPTPTASRSRASIFGLDALSRRLFDSKGSSSKPDVFGGSMSSHRRAKSISRASTQTGSTATDSMRFTHRSNSSATSVTTTDEESTGGGSSPSKSRKLLKRHTSRESSVLHSRESSVEPEAMFSDIDDTADRTIHIDESEQDLARRLELARKNSRAQPESSLNEHHAGIDEVVYEDEPPPPSRPVSRSSAYAPTMSQSLPSTSNIHDTTLRPSSRHSRPVSQASEDPRPLGPRSPSPLPSFGRSYTPTDSDQESAFQGGSHNHYATNEVSGLNLVRSPIPRSKRQTFSPDPSLEETPRPLSMLQVPKEGTEPLSIKKKTPFGEAPTRRSYVVDSPLARSPRTITQQHMLPLQATLLSATNSASVSTPHASSSYTGNWDHLSNTLQTAKEDIEASRRAIKRVRTQLNDDERPQSPVMSLRPTSPVGSGSRIPQRMNPPVNKAAQERMEEMRVMIMKRQGDMSIRPTRPRSNTADALTPRSADPANNQSSGDLLDEADGLLSKVSSNYASIHLGLNEISDQFKHNLSELEKSRSEVQSVRRQAGLIKSLLEDATTEKDIMYESFNEELDRMYEDANMPDDEAWVAMSADLQDAKAARNELDRENSFLRRRIKELESEREEFRALLQAHGLLST